MLHIIWNLTVIGMVTYLFIIFMRAVCELLILVRGLEQSMSKQPLAKVKVIQFRCYAPQSPQTQLRREPTWATLRALLRRSIDLVRQGKLFTGRGR